MTVRSQHPFTVSSRDVLAIAVPASLAFITEPLVGFVDITVIGRLGDAALVAHGIELICLAGFMRILSPAFVSEWRGRILNIHPSLLPAYPGLGTHARVLAAGEKTHGATVHVVTEELDAGATILQESLLVEAGDTAATLAARVHQLEHRIYPAALRQVAEGILKQ